VILIETNVVVVDAEIDVETAVSIVVCYSGLRETPLWGAPKLEGIAFDGIPSLPLIKEEEWATFRNNQEVLDSLVFEIGKQRTRRIIENVYS